MDDSGKTITEVEINTRNISGQFRKTSEKSQNFQEKLSFWQSCLKIFKKIMVPDQDTIFGFDDSGKTIGKKFLGKFRKYLRKGQKCQENATFVNVA